VHITGQAVSHAAAQGTGTDAAATNGATLALTRESKDANKEKESTGNQSKDKDKNTHMAPTKIFKDLRCLLNKRLRSNQERNGQRAHVGRGKYPLPIKQRLSRIDARDGRD
jgi:hypothetical protein